MVYSYIQLQVCTIEYAIEYKRVNCLRASIYHSAYRGIDIEKG